MDFYINKGATLPILKIELINDGNIHDYGDFQDRLENATITFCMTDANTKIKKIGGKPALCILKTDNQSCTGEEYLIGYQFSERDTRNSGTFYGTFTIIFNDDSSKLIVPIKEELMIHVLER